MLAVEVNFLTGRFTATAHHDRRKAEWPPHPARLFSALVATWADADQPDPAERAALEWLERQGPPLIAAPDVFPRKVVTHFVPVNDAAVIPATWYRNRAQQVDLLAQQFEEALEDSHGEITRKVGSIQDRLARQLNVEDQVSKVGKTNPQDAIQLFPESRVKQSREYPSVTLSEPRVTYMWSAQPPTDLKRALDELLSRVSRLGHSSSLVSCRLRSDPPPPSHVPGEGGGVLRSVRAGQLAALEREYDKHRASRPRSLPFTPVRYRSFQTASGTDQHLQPDTSGELLMFEFAPKSRRIPSTKAADFAAVLRAAVFHYAQDPMPEGLSGHNSDGLPSTQPHVGFLALPWVGFTYSDGRLMGMAIGIPQSLDTESRRALLRAVGNWEESAGKAGTPLLLNCGRAGRVELQRIIGVSELVTLRSWVWTHAARRWVSVTPIALPTHPGPLGRGTSAARSKAWKRAERAVLDACRHIGLPEPCEIALSLDPFITGVRSAHHFAAFRQGGTRGNPVARRLVHASVVFDQPVDGPLLLGAGRYLGLGLMRPHSGGEPPS